MDGALDDIDSGDVMTWAPDVISRFEEEYSGWREKGRHVARFAAGDQWDATDKTTRKSNGLPALVFNKFAKYAHALQGVQINNRSYVHFADIGVEDFQLSSLLNKTARATMVDEWERETSDAFGTDLAFYGVGCVFVSMDMAQRIPRAVNERIPIERMAWDITATQTNLLDRRWNNHRKSFTRREMIDAWGKDVVAKCAPNTGKLHGGPQTPAVNETAPYCVDHFQWKRIEYVTKYTVTDLMTGAIHDLTSDDYDAVADQIAMNPALRVEKRRDPLTRWFQAKFCGTTLLEEQTELPFGFTYVFMTGFRDAEGRFVSPLAAAIDPQHFLNYVLSTAVHDYAHSGKGLIVEDTAVKNFNQFAKEYARADRVKRVEDGAISQNRIKHMDGASVSPALVYLLQVAEEGIPSTLGLSAEVLGMVGTEQSNILERTRQNASLTTFQTIFDAERAARREQGRLLLGFMTSYYPEETFLRIGGEEARALLPAIRNIDVMAADIQIDEEPRTISQRQAAVETLQRLGEQMGPAAAGMLPIIVKYLPLPPEDAKALVDGLSPPPDPLREAEVREKEAKTMKTVAESRKIAAETQMMLTESPPDFGAALAESQKQRTLAMNARMKEMEDQRKSQLSAQTHAQDMREAMAKNTFDDLRARRDMAKAQFLSGLKEPANGRNPTA